VRVFILSDLHIGHKDAQYEIMDQAIIYIRQNSRSGDQIWGLGDWFHILENGFSHCLNHPMAQKLRDLAKQIPTRFIPGNHDHELAKYRDNPDLGNPISPISIIHPFADEEIWYCHGHEFDPTTEYLPPWLLWLWNKIHPKVTPSKLKQKDFSEKYLMAVYLVYLRASISLQNKIKEEGLNYKGIVLGHTHLPFLQESPELPFLLDDGDMRHSGTFAVKDDAGFHIMIWKKDRWEDKVIKRP